MILGCRHFFPRVWGNAALMKKEVSFQEIFDFFSIDHHWRWSTSMKPEKGRNSRHILWITPTTSRRKRESKKIIRSTMHTISNKGFIFSSVCSQFFRNAIVKSKTYFWCHFIYIIGYVYLSCWFLLDHLLFLYIKYNSRKFIIVR